MHGFIQDGCTTVSQIFMPEMPNRQSKCTILISQLGNFRAGTIVSYRNRILSIGLTQITLKYQTGKIGIVICRHYDFD